MPDAKELRKIAEDLAANLPADAIEISHKPASLATPEDHKRHKEVFDPLYDFLAVVAEGDEKALRKTVRTVREGEQHTEAEHLLIGAAMRVRPLIPRDD